MLEFLPVDSLDQGSREDAISIGHIGQGGEIHQGEHLLEDVVENELQLGVPRKIAALDPARGGGILRVLFGHGNEVLDVRGVGLQVAGHHDHVSARGLSQESHIAPPRKDNVC